MQSTYIICTLVLHPSLSLLKSFQKRKTNCPKERNLVVVTFPNCDLFSACLVLFPEFLPELPMAPMTYLSTFSLPVFLYFSDSCIFGTLMIPVCNTRNKELIQPTKHLETATWMKQRANPTNRTEPAGNLTTSTWNKELILTRIAQPERALQFALPFFSFNLFPFLFISSFSFSFHFSFFSLFLLSHLIFSLFLSLSYSFCSFIPFTLFNLSHLFLFLLFLL